MSDELFEVAFSGRISEGANLQEVKERIGKMFNADGAKLDQLFSGRRIVIKKNIDQQTAQKYKSAFQQAGAECEIETASAVPAKPVSATPEPAAPPSTAAPKAETATPSTSAASDAPGDVPPPPQVDPLGITGDEINDLEATIAPVGSEMQGEIKRIPEPEYDLSGLDMAPVGSILSDEKKKADPPPPDTSGLSLADS